MKKLAFLLLVALLLPLVACADSLMSVSDLRAQVEASGGRWTQIYTTSKGETISVDVPIEVPNVETFPIIKASWMTRMPDQFKSDYGANGSDRTEPRWSAVIDRYGFIAAFHDFDFMLTQDDLRKYGHFAFISDDLVHANPDWNSAYAYNNDLTVGDAYEYMIQILRECYER